MRQKVKERAFARLDLQIDEKGRVVRNAEKAQAQQEDQELGPTVEKSARMTGDHNMAVMRGPQRAASMSIRHDARSYGTTHASGKLRDATATNTPQHHLKSHLKATDLPPTSKEQKKRNIRAAYNISESEMEQLGVKKRLQRANSRGSVRSTKSTHSATPIMSRYKSGKH